MFKLKTRLSVYTFSCSQHLLRIAFNKLFSWNNLKTSFNNESVLIQKQKIKSFQFILRLHDRRCGFFLHHAPSLAFASCFSELLQWIVTYELIKLLENDFSYFFLQSHLFMPFRALIAKAIVSTVKSQSRISSLRVITLYTTFPSSFLSAIVELLNFEV